MDGGKEAVVKDVQNYLDLHQLIPVSSEEGYRSLSSECVLQVAMEYSIPHAKFEIM